MAKGKKKDAELIEGVDLSSKPDETIIVFKATRPLTESEHEQLSQKVRYENEKSGVKVVLMPYTCEVGGDK
ncbi:MAG: hypothetical protein Q8911_01310 [Bacillota bacterium]|nr:hypothetical protein [Bacillota bacterium]